ncbi:hypothetical protein M9Y10_032017 [Tritrichomonas musculus]|uniref:Ankyrin n=1 Tax=Tritrichomonas musculus TaxID=1915356 RepID=A0ABR2H0F5_9EUKA
MNTSSPLHLAIKKSDIDSIKLLLNHPNIDVNLLNKENDCEKTPLFLAVEKGDREIVNLLLSHPKANANQESKIRNNAISFPNKYGKEVVEYYGNIYYNWMTPLYLAVEKEDEEMVQLLINNEKVDINKTMKTDSKIMNKTALHRAIEVGNQSILRLLLKNDFIDCGCKLIYHSLINTAQYKVKDKYVELSLLCFAIKNGNLETIRTLIEESTIFLNDKSFIEKTIEIVDDDLSLRPENIVKEEIDPILCAIKSNKKDVLQYLLTIPQIDFNCYSKSSNEDLSFDQNTCISSKTSKKLNALQNMTYNIGLIGNKEYNDMNKKKKKVVPNFIEFITMLVDNPRVDINASYYTKITKKKEIFKNNEWVVSTKNKKTFENTAFSFAVEKGFLEVIDILLRHKKIDINRLLNGICENIDKKKKEKSIEKDRYSALHLALFTKKPRAVQKLVDQRNLNINSIYSAELKIAKDKKQTTIKKITKSSFLLAVEKEEINSINILLNSNKVDINAHWICNKNCDIEEKDALFIAIEKKNKDIVNILVNRSDFDFHFIAKNIMGNSSEEYKTHLFAAVENNQYEIAQILLENEKTDVNKKSVFIRPDQSYKKHTLYKTALHIAVEKGFYDIISLLKKYNAEILI